MGITRPYPVISADSHITEPGHAYVDYIDPQWRDRAPRLVHDEDSGDCFAVDGMPKKINLGTAAAAGKPPEELRLRGAEFDKLHRSGWDPAYRRADQEIDGVAAEIIYQIGRAHV